VQDLQNQCEKVEEHKSRTEERLVNRVVELEFDRASDSQTLRQAQDMLNTLRAEMASAQEHKEQIAAKCKEVIVCTSELADDLMSILVEMESDTARTVQWGAEKVSMRFYNGQLQEQVAQLQDDIDALLNQQRSVKADHQAAMKKMGDQCTELQQCVAVLEREKSDVLTELAMLRESHDSRPTQSAPQGEDLQRYLDLMVENGRLECEKFQTRQEVERTRSDSMRAAAMRAALRGRALQQQQRAIDSWRGCAAGSRFSARQSRLFTTKMRRRCFQRCFVGWLVGSREKGRMDRCIIRSISR
jgi:chromosome segregation ATPase